MKRELRLIRRILEYDESQTSCGMRDAPECQQYSWKEVHYHIGLCGQAGYLSICTITGPDEAHPRYEAGNLTWQGHEALDKLRRLPIADAYK